MLEIIFTVIVYLSGAISEYESRGAVTKGVMYQEGNISVVECHAK